MKLIIIGLAALLLIPSNTMEVRKPDEWQGPKTLEQVTKEYAEEYGISFELVSRIIACESNWNPSAYNYKTHDSGLMQINLPLHAKTAKAMSLDLSKVEGNIKYGLHLIRTNGTRDYKASRRCWDK